MRKNQSAEAAATEQTDNTAGATTYEYGSSAEKHDDEDSYSDSFDASDEAKQVSDDSTDKKKGAFGLKLPSKKAAPESQITEGASSKPSLSLTETLREKIAASQRQLSQASKHLPKSGESHATPPQTKSSPVLPPVKTQSGTKPEKKATPLPAVSKAPTGAFGLKPPPRKEDTLPSRADSLPEGAASTALANQRVRFAESDDTDDELLPDIRRGGARPTSYPKRPTPSQPPSSGGGAPSSSSTSIGPVICGAALMLLGGVSAFVWRQFVPPLKVTEMPAGVTDLSAYQGKLIVFSGSIETDSPLRDKVFSLEDNALALKRTAEVYQWNETGQEKVWSESLIAAPAGYENPTKLYFESQEWSAAEWRLGGALLPEEFRRQIPLDYDKKPLNKANYAALSDEAKKAFKLFDGAFMWVKDELNPDVGSIRISYESVPVPRVTVLGTVRAGVFSPFQSGAFRAALVKPGAIPLSGMIAGMKLPADPDAEKLYQTVGYVGGGGFFVIGALIIGVFGRRKTVTSQVKNRTDAKEAPAKRGALPAKPSFRPEAAEAAPAERQKILFGAGRKSASALPLKDLPPLPEEAEGMELKRANDPGTRLPESVHANALYDMAADLKNIPQGIEIIGLDTTSATEESKSPGSRMPEGLEPLDLPDFDSASDKQNATVSSTPKTETKDTIAPPSKHEIKKPVLPVRIKPTGAKLQGLRPLAATEAPKEYQPDTQDENKQIPPETIPPAASVASAPTQSDIPEAFQSSDAAPTQKPLQGVIAKGKFASLAKIGKRDQNATKGGSTVTTESGRHFATEKPTEIKTAEEAPFALLESAPPAAAPMGDEELTENKRAASVQSGEANRQNTPPIKSLKNRIKTGSPSVATPKDKGSVRPHRESENQTLSVTDAFISGASVSLGLESQASENLPNPTKSIASVTDFELEITPAQPTEQAKQQLIPELPAFDFDIEPAQPTEQAKQELIPELPAFDFDIEPAQPTEQAKQELVPELPAFDFDIEPAQPTEQAKQELIPELPAFDFDIEPAQPTEQVKQELAPELPAFDFDIEPAQPTEQVKQELAPELPAFDFDIEPAQPTEQVKQELAPELPAFDFDIEPAQPTEQVKQELAPELPAFDFDIEPAQPTEQVKQELVPELPAFDFDVEPAQPTEQVKQELVPELPAFDFDVEPAQPTEHAYIQTLPESLEMDLEIAPVQSKLPESFQELDFEILSVVTDENLLSTFSKPSKETLQLEPNANERDCHLESENWADEENKSSDNLDDFEQMVDEMIPSACEMNNEISWQSFTESALQREQHDQPNRTKAARLGKEKAQGTSIGIGGTDFKNEISLLPDIETFVHNPHPEPCLAEVNSGPKEFQENLESAATEPDDDLPPLALDLSFRTSNLGASDKKPKIHESVLAEAEDDVPPLLVVH